MSTGFHNVVMTSITKVQDRFHVNTDLKKCGDTEKYLTPAKYIV